MTAVKSSPGQTATPPRKQWSTKAVGLVGGIAIAIIIMVLPMQGWGLERPGQICLALTLMTVVFWATNVAHNGYVSALYLALLVVFEVAGPLFPGVDETTGAVIPSGSSVVFGGWMTPTIWLVIGAYFIAGAVKASGLGERIAYAFLLRYVSSYRSIIVSIYVLTFILSLLIPHPWPRAFLIMSVMAVVITSAKIPREDAVKIGFTVFCASVPVSLIFLTGDAVINPLAIASASNAATAAGYSGPVAMGWIGWFIHMGPPAIVVSVLTCLMNLWLFKPSQEVVVPREEIHAKLKGLGKMTETEIRTVVWLSIAVVLWMTDFLHGIPLGIVTIAVAALMAFPYIGEVLKPGDWGGIPLQVLVFLTAAISIGTVGGVSGMNSWIATTLLPDSAPRNLFILAAIVTVIAIVIHMLLGSVIAVMGVAVPAIVAFTAPAGLNPLVPTLIVYMAIAAHYILPFQHLNMLVGASPDTGGFTQRETIRMGLPLTAVMFLITMGVMVPWFMLTGLAGA